MANSKASAVWNGTLKEGNGTMSLGSGPSDIPFTFASRFEDGKETNPEELIGAAHAGCFSMYLSAILEKAGFPATKISTAAAVTLEGTTITAINLTVDATVPNIDIVTFQEQIVDAKKDCPVSKALAGIASVEVEAHLNR